MNNKGQLTVEYILLLSIIILVIVSSMSVIFVESEKNIILISAQIGAQNGVDKNGYAVYYNDTFNNYQDNYPKLLSSNKIKIIKIELVELSQNKIKIKTKAHTTSLNSKEKQIVSSRINYYIRRSISQTFKKDQNDIYYDPAYSYNYEITTQNIEWV